MQIQTVQIVAALLSAVAFVIAFISAGAAVISAVFAFIGALALAWLVYTVAKRILLHRSERNATPTA
jgi:ABC-type Fe3+-siderophore transport system permease subunit